MASTPSKQPDGEVCLQPVAARGHKFRWGRQTLDQGTLLIATHTFHITFLIIKYITQSYQGNHNI